MIDNKINVYQTTADGQRFNFKQISFTNFNETNGKFTSNVEATLTIDLNKTRQKIAGFGGAFTDAACQNLMKLNEDVRQQIIDDYFDQKNGLEYVLGKF